MAFLPIFSRPCTRPIGGNGLAFAGDGRRGSGDEDQLAADGNCGVVQQLELELGAVGPEAFDVFFGQVELFDDGFNGEQIFVHGPPKISIGIEKAT